MALLTSACTATVSTAITVSPSGATAIVAGTAFSGEIGAKLASDRALRTQLTQVITARLHQAITLSVSASSVSWRAPITYAQLTANSDITGIQSAALTHIGPQQAQVVVSLVTPTAIGRAITAGVVGQKDAGAVATTMRSYTDVSVTITFPGAVAVSASPGIHPTINGTTVNVSQSLSGYTTGTLTVRGSLVASSFPWIWVGGGAVSIGAVLWFGRRRATDTSLASTAS